MSQNDPKRKRSGSLRTQMFNKHLYDKFRQNSSQDDSEPVELSDTIETTVEEDQETGEEDFEIEQDAIIDQVVCKTGFLPRTLDLLLNRQRILHSKSGRHIPITLDHTLAEYSKFTSADSDQLIDERTDKPYCNNSITSSRYTIYSFLPKQLYAQFSKLANAYFFIVSILQMIPGWSTTGTYTTIVPLLIFMAISMAREAWDDFRRHRLDMEENKRICQVLTKDINNEVRSHSNSGLPNNESLNTHFTNFDLLASKHNVVIEEKQWKDLCVGDFVYLKQDDCVPADILLLISDGDNTEAFAETMALDGETNLKSRHPHPELSKLTCSASGLANINAQVTVEDPNDDLYNFEGNLELQDRNDNTIRKFPIGPENVIYRGSIIRNTRNLVGIVISSGEETKVRMNALKNPRIKAPKLQRKINMIIALMVLVVICMSMFSYMGHVLFNKKYLNENQAWYLYKQDAGVAPTIMSYLVMYNTLIPLSLYVTMEIIKVMQCKMMEWDIDIYHSESDTPCEARTATILEELGQVSYIFSDKTGTLTDNKMVFRKFSLLGSSWIHYADPSENSSLALGQQDTELDVVSIEDRSFLNQFGIRDNDQNSMNSHELRNRSIHPRTSVEFKGNSSAKYSGRPSMSSLYGRMKPVSDSLSTINSHGSSATGNENIKSSYELIRYIQKFPDTEFAKKARFFILSIALCHSCLPQKVTSDADNEENDTIEYQSSSPDELALITAARDLGYIVINRNAKILTVKSFPHGFDSQPILEDYEILDTVEFNSQRKRMSVIVKFPGPEGKLLLICKGADNVILERLHNSAIALKKMEDINAAISERKETEAEVVLQQRKSLERIAYDGNNPRSSLRSALSDPRESLSLKAMRTSLSSKNNKRTDPEMQIGSIDAFLDTVKKADREINEVISRSRKSLHKQQHEKYGPRYSLDSQVIDKNGRLNVSISSDEKEMLEYIGDDKLISNEEYIIEKTIQAIDEFSMEGLRTLLYSYKWLDEDEYATWRTRYHDAKTSLIDRKRRIDEVGEEIEKNMGLLGATAIEDKLQEGVAETIEKIRRAGIKMWMLTGDKRETAINIGYSCRLIYDYSTVVILTSNDENIISKMNAVLQEMASSNIAHCVIVIDGLTLGLFEGNPILMSVFIELCTKADSVICCRASPSQKALMVSNIRKTDKSMVTLAIGDGANDISMIQNADIGIGIAGKEGLQASRSSDYSIAQFRYLSKVLFVHGRYNYIRTSKFVLCTFYKELTFYLTQMIYQRWTMFSGTSMYEPWSLSMFNTLFTSLPVLCIGMFEKDLKPMTLLSVPELYSLGRLSEGFSLSMFIEWLILGTVNSLLVTFLNVLMWGYTSLSDNTLYPLGVINFTAIVVLVNVKSQFVEMRNRNWLALASVILSCGGWLVWCCALPVINHSDQIYDVPYGFLHHFGRDITFWCSCLALAVLPTTLDIVFKTFKKLLWPSDSDIFSELEQRSNIRKKLEMGAYNEMKQGWTWERDPNAFKRYKEKIKSSSGSKASLSSGIDTVVTNDKTKEVNDATPDVTPALRDQISSSKNASEVYEVLPSGKIIRRESLQSYNNGTEPNNVASRLSKKLRFKLTKRSEDEEEIKEIVEQRMKDLE
ncbi:hypothetical protein KAFR_0B04880 [Kazachstania africana CBS 2517]|uniref:Phospholipid-transporting ATPase n=1 Tax=Kazachstania africana (strain ATCC 22294 / BCRC 22015 / CBS 2517 / CECT 1963 / NBRC 1671 / NRRL Y-8276) TaxID=1071382 RepID=H2AQY4_KAZAF|nr:hypothetical protein KAFR_0B04880 [Kazachstania africana CBS 2517]CCF56784.1 hypothetical protein KAFR_0B04880 [Kazachstania africana CBS 2517]